MRISLNTSGKTDELPLDPRTKMLLLITISFIMLSGSYKGTEFVLQIICASVPLFLILNIRRYSMALIYLLLLAFSECCAAYVMPQVEGVMNMILMILCSLITRFVPGMMMGWYFVRSTSVIEFVTAMEKMHMPNFITIPISVMFRYFPTLGEEYRSIHDAMKMREIGFNIEYVLVPLMMSTVRIADELSAASLTKGLLAYGKRTHICRIKLNLLDIILIIGSLAMIAVFTIGRAIA